MADETTDGMAPIEIASSEGYGIVASRVCTSIIALLAAIFAFYPMDTAFLKIVALVLIAQPCFVSIALAIEHTRLIEVDRIARIARENAQATVEADRYSHQTTLLQTILESQKPDREKIKDLESYAVAGRAFALIDEISKYVENNRLPQPRRPGPAVRALGGPIPWEQTPQAMMARAYKETFGARLKALVEQFKELGIELPQTDESYFDPGMHIWVPLAISQLKAAATQIVNSLQGTLAVKSTSLGAAATVTKPGERR